MFLLRSQPQPTGPTLNAIAPAPEQTQRRTRHLAQCERLAELGMELAEAAHREALRDLAAPIEHRRPGMAAPPACAEPAPGRLFTQLSRCVRQAILLEARLAAGAYDHPPADAAATPTTPTGTYHTPSQPPPVRPDHVLADRLEQVENDLAGEMNRSIPEILSGICRDLGAAITPADTVPHALREATPVAEPCFEPPRPRPLSALERSAALAERPRPQPPPR